jgi:hypothetical protein
VSFAAKTLSIASQRVFIVVSVYFVIDSVRKILETPSYITLNVEADLNHYNLSGKMYTRFQRVYSATLHFYYPMGTGDFFPGGKVAGA